jgi:hypothetical protein
VAEFRGKTIVCERCGSDTVNVQRERSVVADSDDGDNIYEISCEQCGLHINGQFLLTERAEVTTRAQRTYYKNMYGTPPERKPMTPGRVEKRPGHMPGDTKENPDNPYLLPIEEVAGDEMA